MNCSGYDERVLIKSHPWKPYHSGGFRRSEPHRATSPNFNFKPQGGVEEQSGDFTRQLLSTGGGGGGIFFTCNLSFLVVKKKA